MFDKKKFKAAVLYADKTYQDVADALDMHINGTYIPWIIRSPNCF